MKLKFEILIEKDGDGFHAYCPALKGMHVFGATLDEAVANSQKAIEGYLESLQKHNDPIPVGCVVVENAQRSRLPHFFTRLFSSQSEPVRRELLIPA